MAKFIIDNSSSADDSIAIDLVANVIKAGKISNNGKNYCYVTTYTTLVGDLIVYAQRNEKSSKFTVSDG